MKRLLLLCGVLFISLQLRSQVNLVPNPSFEEYDSIISYTPDSIIFGVQYYPKYWFCPVSCGYQFYFNSKLNNIDQNASGISIYGVPQNPWSYTFPLDGTAQSAICPGGISSGEGFRNYMEVKLNSPLISGHSYNISFFITLADSCYIAIDQIGAYLSTDSLIDYTFDAINGYCEFIENPQIVSPPGQYFSLRNLWYPVSGYFIAQGGEQYLTLGNFKVDSNTNYLSLPDVSNFGPGSYYYLDLVSVFEIDSIIRRANAGKDSTICIGDSVRIGTIGSVTGYEFAWSPGIGLSDSSIQNPIASPLQTTTYALRQIYYSTDTTYDTITVTVQQCNPVVKEIIDRENKITVYPNPAGKLLYVSGLTEKAIAEVYALSGKLLLTKQLNTNQIDISGLAKGLYFIKLTTAEGSVVRKFVKE